MRDQANIDTQRGCLTKQAFFLPPAIYWYLQILTPKNKMGPLSDATCFLVLQLTGSLDFKLVSILLFWMKGLLQSLCWVCNIRHCQVIFSEDSKDSSHKLVMLRNLGDAPGDSRRKVLEWSWKFIIRLFIVCSSDEQDIPENKLKKLIICDRWLDTTSKWNFSGVSFMSILQP